MSGWQKKYGKGSEPRLSSSNWTRTLLNDLDRSEVYNNKQDHFVFDNCKENEKFNDWIIDVREQAMNEAKTKTNQHESFNNLIDFQKLEDDGCTTSEVQHRVRSVLENISNNSERNLESYTCKDIRRSNQFRMNKEADDLNDEGILMGKKNYKDSKRESVANNDSCSIIHTEESCINENYYQQKLSEFHERKSDRLKKIYFQNFTSYCFRCKKLVNSNKQKIIHRKWNRILKSWFLHVHQMKRWSDEITRLSIIKQLRRSFNCIVAYRIYSLRRAQVGGIMFVTSLSNILVNLGDLFPFQ